MSLGSFDQKQAARGPTLDSLMRYDGEEFITHAYLEILGRRPDRDGAAFYSGQLFSGRFGKVDILEALQQSDEAQKRGVRIVGLERKSLSRRLFKIPVLGYALRALWLVISLPRVMRSQAAFETHVRVHLSTLATQLKASERARNDLANRLTAETNSKIANAAGKLDRRVETLERTGLGWQAEAREALLRGEARVGEIIDALDALAKDVETQFVPYRASLLDQERRLTIFLEEARRRLPAPFDEEQLSVLAAERDHMLDRLYLMIEDRFRGTRADIKSRQKLYLPEARAAAGDSNLPVIDLGCGRGEWLELLQGEGIKAIGVDTNETMRETCGALGLEVVGADATEFLRGAQAGAFSAITGFHIIEHMPFPSLIALIDEALRTLKPGGALIFETPNPSNILVATHTFNLDPTHRKPLPSALTTALLEARGFVRVEVRNLFPLPGQADHYDLNVLNAVNQLLNGPQDYGVIAWKPGP